VSCTNAQSYKRNHITSIIFTNLKTDLQYFPSTLCTMLLRIVTDVTKHTPSIIPDVFNFCSVLGDTWVMGDPAIVYTVNALFPVFYMLFSKFNRLCGQSSGYRSRGPGFDSQLPDFMTSSGSGTGSTQPREDNWGATWKKVATPV
jgi:hypothetical protein